MVFLKLTQEKELFQLKVLPMSYIMVCVRAFVCVRAWCGGAWGVYCVCCVSLLSLSGEDALGERVEIEKILPIRDSDKKKYSE